MKTDIILLASGYSRRFSGNKLLYPFQGMPLIEHVLKKVTQLHAHNVIVVTQYPEVEALAKQYGASVVFNEHALEGQSSSIRLGISKSTSHQALLCVADQPFLKLETLERMLKISDGEHIVCASCRGGLRNPAIFPRKYYEELLFLEKEQGGKVLLRKYIDEVITLECEEEELRDMDEKKDVLKNEL